MSSYLLFASVILLVFILAIGLFNSYIQKVTRALDNTLQWSGGNRAILSEKGVPLGFALNLSKYSKSRMFSLFFHKNEKVTIFTFMKAQFLDWFEKTRIYKFYDRKIKKRIKIFFLKRSKEIYVCMRSLNKIQWDPNKPSKGILKMLERAPLKGDKVTIDELQKNHSLEEILRYIEGGSIITLDEFRRRKDTIIEEYAQNLRRRKKES